MNLITFLLGMMAGVACGLVLAALMIMAKDQARGGGE